MHCWPRQPNQQNGGQQLLTKVALASSRFAGSDPASRQTNKSTTFLRRFQKSAGSGNWEELHGFLPCFAEPAFAAAVVVVFTGVRFLPVVHQWLAAMG